MKKSNKGFTLIELLAAIVILGILIAFSIPMILSLLDTSRNKMYVDDAKKLVTEAEYKLKANSSNIEKPDDGDCIVISMAYLDSSSFDNPPNKGTYEKESSFVVVKNVNGKLEYSVTTVERIKGGGYKGVELVKDSELISRTSVNHVVTFNASDVKNVETDVNKNYINAKLGNNYISSSNDVVAIYNTVTSEDEDDVTITEIPRITSASLTSTSNREYNSLDATLKLKVKDKDSPLNTLSIYLSTVSYDDAINSSPFSYGDGSSFTHDIVFNNTYDGSSVKLYIIVKDSSGNITRKTITYKLHKNEKPEIYDDKSSIKKRDTDTYNMTVASLKLSVYDDVDDFDHLMVCFKESTTNENFDTCDDYHSYNSYFDSENTMDYQFKCGSNCTRDGSTHYLTAFVKDSYGEVVKKKFQYTFSTNTVPSITNFKIESQRERFTTEHSKTIFISFDAEDDLDKDNQLTVKVTANDSDLVTYNYANKPFKYDINSRYDGSTKNIKVTVVDSEGLEVSKTQDYTLYQDVKPTVSLFDVYSKEIPCNNSTYCPIENNGNYNAYYKLKVSDDIDSDDVISICLSETDSCSSYTSYSNYYNSDGSAKEFSHTFSVSNPSKPYNGEEKHYYLFAKDSSGNILKKDYSYKLYENKGPIIKGNPILVSNDSEINIPNATYKIVAEDDFDSSFMIKYCYKSGDDSFCTEYEDYQETKLLDNSFFGVNYPNGKEYKVYSILKDSYGSETKSSEIKYKLHEDKAPVIYSKDIVSGGIVYKNDSGDVVESLDGVDNPSSYTLYTRLKISFTVDDPHDKYSICLSESNTSCDNYYGTYNGNDCGNGTCDRITYNTYYDRIGTISSGDNVSIYLYVKDSYNNQISDSLYNKEYIECSEYDMEDAKYKYTFDSSTTQSETGSSEAISIDRCAGKCYSYNSSTSENNNIVAYYTKEVSYTDKFNSKVQCNGGNPITSSYKAGCDFKDCFYKNGNYNRNAIGTRVINDEQPWTLNINGNEYVCTAHYNLYLSSYTSEKENISLTKTNNMICKSAFDNNEYVYDTNSSNPYVIVDD